MTKKEINIVDSPEHSYLLFVLCKNKMYASELADKVKEQQGTIQRRLMKLKKKGFAVLEEHPEKKKNIKLFSVNWEKITDEFFRLLKEHKKEFLETHQQIKTNLAIEKLEEINLLDDKLFIEDLKKNRYLRYAFKEYFTQISELKKVSLSSAFFYLIFFGNFDFIYSTYPSLWSFVNWREKKKHENKEFKSDREVRKEANKFMANLEKNMNKQEEIIHDVIFKDKDLKNFLMFNKIMRTLSSDLALQLALNEATELTAFSIIKENFPENEISEYQKQPFSLPSSRYKIAQNEIIKNISENIMQGFEERTKENANDDEKTKQFKKLLKIAEEEKPKAQNDLEVAKPTENRHKKAGNTNQNTALSSENNQGESSK